MSYNSEEILKTVSDKKQTCWINPFHLPFETVDAICQLVVSDEAIEDAKLRLERFAPFIRKEFPQTGVNGGLIESPLEEINLMRKALEKKYSCKIPGRFFLKMDSHLDIAGSVKARGGIYEVLKHAEDLALSCGKITKDDDYTKFCSDEMKSFFSDYTVQVGSTGNLGLSIGIMSAALGFNVIVHMSADAKEWKKKLLAARGVKVVEYSGDYSAAVANGRALSCEDPSSYFVDDEWSVDLFLGYAVAAKRLHSQLTEKNIPVDKNHPLIVYIPCGVGGAPGGISYGLKRIFGDNVHCFFAEPCLFPSVLLGIATQKFEKANVKDYMLNDISIADGLACPSPSGFVTRIMTNILSGDFTVCEGSFYDYMRLLYTSEGIKVEPSGCAGFEGAVKLLEYESSKDYCRSNGITEDVLENSTQIVWATGGKMVPDEIFEEYLKTYI